MQSAEADKGSPCAIVVGNPVGAVCVGDVDLDHDEVGRVVEGERLDVFVDDHCAGRREIRYAASVASPSGGNSEYLIGRQ